MGHPNIISGPEGGHDGVPPTPPDQVAFMERLRTITPRLVGELPQVAPHILHDASGYNTLVPEYQHMGEQLDNAHFSGAILAPYREAGERGPATIGFDPQVFWSLGRAKSHRGTFFGELQLTSATGRIDTVPVAVKPFLYEEAGNAIQELAMLEYLAAQGVESLEPVGIIMHRWNNPPTVYLLTRLRQELSSLDSPERWAGVRRETMADALTPAVETLVMLHGKAVSHGDPKLRNIGVGESEDVRIPHDFEFASSFKDIVEGVGDQDAIPAILPELLDQEFRNLFGSLREVVYPYLPPEQRPQTPQEEFELQLGVFLELYQAAMARSNSPYRSVLERAYRVWLQTRTLEMQ